MNCTKCNKINDNDAKFCIYCGSDFQSNESKKVWKIGRNPENDIVKNYPMVSGNHCQITNQNNQFFLMDLQSSNGTFINGLNLEPNKDYVLQKNDKVNLGSYDLNIDFLFSASASDNENKFIREQKSGSQKRLSIGRSTKSDIIIDYPQVSSLHAWLINDGNKWFVEDRNSSNHTYVNDRSRPIKKEQIAYDDTIYFGSYKISAGRLLSMKKNTALGRGNPHSITIKNTQTIFGRDPKAGIFLNYSQISWHHARLTVKQDSFFIEDLNSTNGTFVNGKKIKSCLVSSSDIISLGSYSFKLTEDNKIIKRDHQNDICLDAENITIEVYDKNTRKPKKLLNNISFSIYPTEFVGLMGPSGAGKTTLMLALNGYWPPKPEHGFSKINNQSLYNNYNLFRGYIGYVPQDDIIHQELTVYEALYYTARLRLPSDTSKKEINERIDKVLTQLGLLDDNSDVRNIIIGSPEKKGISGGQRKRVNLAMELLTDPSILFLDEPTSGLSSQDTLIVMDLLRRLANEGKTIILTIHQPSLEAYKKMDNVIILSQGKLMYYGPAYPDSITFFNPDIPDDQVVGNADNALKGMAAKSDSEWEKHYNSSSYFEKYIQNRQKKNESSNNSNGSNKIFAKNNFSSSFFQWWILTRRYFTVKRKDVINTAILLLQAPIIAFLISLVFHNNENTYIPLFLLVISALWFGTSNSAREIVAEKAIYQRERMVNLKIHSYVFSKFAVLGFLCLIQCIVLVGIVYTILELKGNIYLLLGVMFITALSGLSIGLFLSSITKTQQAAVAIVPIILLPMVILGGGMQFVCEMNKPAIALSYIMPSRWAFEQVLHIEDNSKEQKTDSQSNLSNSLDSKKAIPCYVKKLFDEYENSEITIISVLIVFVSIFILLTMINLKRRDIV